MELIGCLVKMRFFGSKTKCSLLLGAWCSAAAVGGGGVKMLLLRCMRSRAEHGPRPHKSRAGVSEALGTQLVDQRECI